MAKRRTPTAKAKAAYNRLIVKSADRLLSTLSKHNKKELHRIINKHSK